MNSQSEHSNPPLEPRSSPDPTTPDRPSPAGPDFADAFRRRRVRGPRGMAPGRRVWTTLGWTAAAVAAPLALTAALAGDGAGDLGDSQEAAAARALPPPPAVVVSPTPAASASPTPKASPSPKASPTPVAPPLPAAPAQAYQPPLPAAPTPQKTVPATPKPSAAAPKAAPVPETAALTVSRLAARQPGRHICYRAYVEGNGWQSVVCDGGTTGITGRKIKALNIAVSGTKGTAGNAFVHNDEWKTPWNGVADGIDNYIGSTAKNYPYMLGFVINVGDGAVCQSARVRSGWGGLACDKPIGQASGNYIFGGTLNNDSWLEAVRFTV